LGRAFASENFTHFYASDLKRAHSTALAVHTRLRATPRPHLTITPTVREQHFGAAEGNTWVATMPAGESREALQVRGVYPAYFARDEKFEGGESADDVARRVERALRECVLPHLNDVDSHQDTHIAIASHGIAIAEMIAALTRLDPAFESRRKYRGLVNTAWARVLVEVPDSHLGKIDVDQPPPLKVSVTHFNEADHLVDITEEVVDEATTATSNEARKFFGGGDEPKEAVSATNARVDVGSASL